VIPLFDRLDDLGRAAGAREHSSRGAAAMTTRSEPIVHLTEATLDA
jgi:hypothetical protein